MIRAVRIERFRGIRACAADGFGRVNLVIGKNDCGKTAFMEAVMLAEKPENVAVSLLNLQRERLRRTVKPTDFERFWLPVFYGLNSDAGLALSVADDDLAWNKVDIQQGVAADEIVLNPPNAAVGADSVYDVNSAIRTPAWALDIQVTISGKTAPPQRVEGTSARLRLSPHTTLHGSGWIGTQAGNDEHEVRNVSAMKQRGQDGELVELLREVDERIVGIELLAPGGDVAELFVRLDNGTPILPVALMGEGFQRCLSLGAAAAAHDWPTLFIDEIENGMHHLVLEPLWRWVATIARRRNLQVFATTHSEECIQAASRAFKSIGDDGLRVIRLDRTKDGTRATVYDRALVETAERTGTEIRG